MFYVSGLPGANGSSSSRKSNATSLKMLLEKEMSKEVESKRRPPSVIGKLMGLEDDLPIEEPIVCRAKINLTRDLIASTEILHGKEHHHYISLNTQDHQSRDEIIEYNDVYEVSHQQLVPSCCQDQTSLKGWPSESKSRQFDVAQARFIKPKCFALEEKHLNTKDLQEVPEVLCANKDLVLETPEEHNYTFSRQLSRLHTNQGPPQKKRITVLKPIKTVKINDTRQSRTEQVSKKNVLEMRKSHQIPSSKEEISSQPSRIVLLRPTPGKPGISKAKLISRANSFQLMNRNSLNGSVHYNQETVGSSGLVHDIMQHRQDGCHQRDDSLLSSAYSNGYVGDESSFSDSEVDYSSGSEIDCVEDGGTHTLSDSEGGGPLPKHSWNCRRYEGPYSSSSLSKISHFSESSVIREAKKQLSERWAVVTCDEISQEQVQSSRRTCTLGEMLSIKEVKKEDLSTEIRPASSNQSCSLDNESTVQSTYVTSKLPRSNSVPMISSTFDTMVADVQDSNPESRKLKMVVVSNKGKSSSKGRVLDFFLSRSRKPIRQKNTHPSDLFLRGLKLVSSVRSSAGVTISLDCPRGSLDKLGVNKCINSNRDQPSPTSVLDAPSEDSSCNEPETSGRTSKNTKVWSILKDWIYGARLFVVSRRDNSGIMLDRIVKQEVEGRGWVNSMMMQVVDITEHLEGGVMEELVEEAVLDFTVCFRR
ncbi:hypothetical protein HU200_013064 [Digitaria exilis]|uniref:DUF4378 domain-containing protein n=1 Tax=Digitaria exilis TaxID=1010633 RepID=A0A835KP61_9POAL|nr:hypothetical protein HU200_013064 [Digitaria exilis]